MQKKYKRVQFLERKKLLTSLLPSPHKLHKIRVLSKVLCFTLPISGFIFKLTVRFFVTSKKSCHLFTPTITITFGNEMLYEYRTTRKWCKWKIESSILFMELFWRYRLQKWLGEGGGVISFFDSKVLPITEPQRQYYIFCIPIYQRIYVHTYVLR